MNRLDHHILAAYFNDARLNILLCLNDIREKTGKKPVSDEAQIAEVFNSFSLSDIGLERQKILIRHLRRHFPFLDVLTDSGKKGPSTPEPRFYSSILGWLFPLVNTLRDTMVHPAEQDAEIDHQLHRKLFFALNSIYDSSLRTVTTRFELNPTTIRPLLRCGNKGKAKLLNSFSLALCTSPQQAKNKKAEEHLRQLSPKKQSQVLHDFGRVLLCSIFLDKSQSAELVSYFWRTEAGQKWTAQQRSIIKEVLSIYRIRLPLQRLHTDDTTNTVTLDTLAELSRCPGLLFDSLSSADQERFRVGASLTSPGEEDELENNEISGLLKRGNQNRFLPLLLRFLDFDPNCRLYFAVDLGQFYYNVRLKPADRFTDDRSRVRRLGQKILSYGRLSDFEQAEKHPFWQQLEANRAASSDEEEINYNTSESIEQLKPYIVPCTPHYHYDEMKIGFRLAEGKKTAVYPDLSVRDTEEASRNIALDPIKKEEKRRLMEPDFWGSPAQMLHLAFYIHLQKSRPGFLGLDILLRRYRSGMKKMLRALQEGSPELTSATFSEERRTQSQQWADSFFDNRDGSLFSVALADMPKVLGLHLAGATERQVSVQEAVSRAVYLLEETEVRQERIKKMLQMSKTKKRGKKGFRPIKCGIIGDFLAEDLVRFQPKDTAKSDGGKLNSQQYQILQAALAYYGAHVDESPTIVDLLRDAGLLEDDFAHPFLEQLNLIKNPKQYTGLVNFYEAYLKARKTFLEGFIRETKKRSDINRPPNWLRLRQHSTLHSWLDEQLDSSGNLLQPLPLPKNMLYQPLLAMTAEEVNLSKDALYQEGMQRFTRNGKEAEVRPAVSWLIRRYLAHQGDAAQEMYRYPRHHDLFDSFFDKRKGKQRFQKKWIHCLPEEQRKEHLNTIREFIGKTEDEEKKAKLTRLLRVYKGHEKKLRHLAEQDIILYLFARRYLNTLQLDETAPPPNWSLRGLEHTLLTTQIVYALEVPETGKSLLHPQCKIKNLGELRLLVRDRRLPSLLHYYPKDETGINQAEIRAELASYRRARVKVMHLVHTLEREIDRCCDWLPGQKPPIEEKDSFGQGRHGGLLYALYQRVREEEAGGESNRSDAFAPVCFHKALLLRNAFSHNEYPDAGDFTESVAAVRQEAVPENPANHRKVAEKLAAKMEELYQPWLDYLTALRRKE